MLIWMQERDLFIAEFLRLEAAEEELVTCSTPDCPDMGLFRCPQCSDSRLFCQTCIVQRHEASPFHVVEVRPCPYRILSAVKLIDMTEMELPVLHSLLAPVTRAFNSTRASYRRLMPKPYPCVRKGLHGHHLPRHCHHHPPLLRLC